MSGLNDKEKIEVSKIELPNKEIFDIKDAYLRECLDILLGRKQTDNTQKVDNS